MGEMGLKAKLEKAGSSWLCLAPMLPSLNVVFGIFLRDAIVQTQIVKWVLETEAISIGNFPLDYP